ncbi:hypothetical protein FA13DRAFT_1732553 [Coprinellus micaceus]|uniref:G domain-containing protein n=1 Tax=Coprinellus micaceus TaxID=71717 RepID=A0A4Y7TCM7_COPMI|nr:hypothetical protein FA13DRAFT_1732553 [Coprinellus micaceus]
MPAPKFHTKEGKQIDKFFKQISDQVEDDDVILPVFGPSGCGRSLFIDKLLPPDATRRPNVQGGLQSVTKSCELFVVESGPFRRNSDYRKLPGRLVMIDTPGFHNSHASDEKVAQDIGSCLQSLYSQRKVWVAGAIVMVSIENDRIRPARSDSLPDELNSQSAPRPVAIVTSHWDFLADLTEGRRKEAILRKSLWVNAPEHALMFRFDKTSDSAWKAVDGIVHEFASLSGVVGDGTARHRKHRSTLRKERRRYAGIIGRLVYFVVGLVHGQRMGGRRGP